MNEQEKAKMMHDFKIFMEIYMDYETEEITVTIHDYDAYYTIAEGEGKTIQEAIDEAFATWKGYLT